MALGHVARRMLQCRTTLLGCLNNVRAAACRQAERIAFSVPVLEMFIKSTQILRHFKLRYSLYYMTKNTKTICHDISRISIKYKRLFSDECLIYSLMLRKALWLYQPIQNSVRFSIVLSNRIINNVSACLRRPSSCP